MKKHAKARYKTRDTCVKSCEKTWYSRKNTLQNTFNLTKQVTKHVILTVFRLITWYLDIISGYCEKGCKLGVVQKIAVKCIYILLLDRFNVNLTELGIANVYKLCQWSFIGILQTCCMHLQWLNWPFIHTWMIFLYASTRIKSTIETLLSHSLKLPYSCSNSYHTKFKLGGPKNFTNHRLLS